ncbi:thiosulfate ABC transporter substrate-binding protein CysP [Granulosicoccaceae sp. 1_MG-2023]|nr:thiosulfate ABC transporter substrate-binding protein CysP [Granulosicoccaceae sp. 1_MG-2023]
MKTLKSLLVAGLLSAAALPAGATTLLNTSYDIARELFAAYNPMFIEHWKETTGEEIEIKQSHAGSSKQARAILQGLPADVVTFNQVTDIQVLHDKGQLIPADWKSRLSNGSSPYYSTTAFLVRKGNPKGIEDWDDLLENGTEVVFPNPKTSGNGRYTYLAALGFAQNAFGDDEEKIDDFVSRFLKSVKVFDTGGRGATTTFVERKIGDVLITFESEVNNIKAQYPDDAYEVVVPKTSILAEFPVAWIDSNVEKNGTTEVAKAYLEYLYSEPAQRLLAGFNYRVHNDTVKQENAEKFPEVKLLTVEEIAGSWPQAMEAHFASGAKLDQLQAR